MILAELIECTRTLNMNILNQIETARYSPRLKSYVIDTLTRMKTPVILFLSWYLNQSN